jgi:hypothetical protein
MKKIKILAYVYKVIPVKGLTARVDGIAIHDPIALEIHTDPASETIREDLMHEVFESIKWQNELSVRHSTLTSLANGVCAVLKDNPEFLKLFMEKE